MSSLFTNTDSTVLVHVLHYIRNPLSMSAVFQFVTIGPRWWGDQPRWRLV